MNENEDTLEIDRKLELVEDENEKIAYLRAKSISCLLMKCASSFQHNAEAILAGNFQGDLLGNDPETKR